MRNSLERAFNTQAKQVISEVKSKNIGSNKAFVTMPVQERDQGDLELPNIAPSSKHGLETLDM